MPKTRDTGASDPWPGLVPGAGQDFYLASGAADDKFRFRRPGEAHPRVEIDLSGTVGAVKVGTGVTAPLALSGGGVPGGSPLGTYDVTQFGLLDDDATDNTAAYAGMLFTLVAQGVTHADLYFPKKTTGHYRFTTGGPSIAHSHWGLSGDGVGVTFIDNYNGTAGVSFIRFLGTEPTPGSFAGRLEHNHLCDLTINNKGNNDSIGLECFAVTHLHVERVQFRTWRRNALKGHNFSDSRFNDCEWEYNGSADASSNHPAIWLGLGSSAEWASDQIWFSNNRFEHNAMLLRATSSGGFYVNKVRFLGGKVENVLSDGNGLSGNEAYVVLTATNFVLFDGVDFTFANLRTGSPTQAALPAIIKAFSTSSTMVVNCYFTIERTVRSFTDYLWFDGNYSPVVVGTNFDVSTNNQPAAAHAAVLWTGTNTRAQLSCDYGWIQSGSPALEQGVPTSLAARPSAITVAEGGVALDTTVRTIDFAGADFDLTETPEDEVNVSIAAAIARNSDVTASMTWHEALADPHTGYVLESLVDAKGDLVVGTADNTVAKLAVGTNTYVLTADSTQASGVKWAAGGSGGGSALTVSEGGAPLDTSVTTIDFAGADFDLTETPEDEVNVSIAAAIARNSDVTASMTWHEALADPHTGYVLESLVDAKGDLVVGTANNTVAKLAVGANTYVLTADSTQASGVKWAVGGSGGGVTYAGGPLFIAASDAPAAEIATAHVICTGTNASPTDHTAINNAMQALLSDTTGRRGAIELSTGTFQLGGPILIPARGFMLRGQGLLTRIRAASGFNGTAGEGATSGLIKLAATDAGRYACGVRISDLYLDCNVGATSGIVFDQTNAANGSAAILTGTGSSGAYGQPVTQNNADTWHHFSNMHIYEPQHGIYFIGGSASNGRGNRVEHVTVHQAYASGFTNDNASDLVLLACSALTDRSSGAVIGFDVGGGNTRLIGCKCAYYTNTNSTAFNFAASRISAFGCEAQDFYNGFKISGPNFFGDIRCDTQEASAGTCIYIDDDRAHVDAQILLRSAVTVAKGIHFSTSGRKDHTIRASIDEGPTGGDITNRISIDTGAEITNVDSLPAGSYDIRLRGPNGTPIGYLRSGVPSALASGISSLNLFGHSWLTGAPTTDTGVVDIERNGMGARLAALLGVHMDNISHYAQAGTQLTRAPAVTTTGPQGWYAIANYLLPDNNPITLGSEVPVPMTNQDVSTPGATVAVFGVNDLANVFFYTSQQEITSNGIPAWKNVLRWFISRARASSLLSSYYSNGAIVWDTRLAFGSSWVSGTIDGRGTGPGTRILTTQSATPADNAVTFTMPTAFKGGYVVATFTAPPNVGCVTNASIASGTTGNVVAWTAPNAYFGNAVPFPTSGNFVLHIDSEDILCAPNNTTTLNLITRGYNGTSAAAHSIGAYCSITDPSVITFTTNGTGADATAITSPGTLSVGAQGRPGTVAIPICRRFLVSSAMAGKTITATLSGKVTGDVQGIGFDTWHIESSKPNPFVLLDTPEYAFSSVLWNGVITNAPALNQASRDVIAEFNGLAGPVQLADLNTPWKGRTATLTGAITDTALSVSVTALGTASQWPQEVNGWLLAIEDERVLVTSRTAAAHPNYTYGIIRAQPENTGSATTAAAHASGVFASDASIMHDGVHPNATGHAEAAQAMFDAFTRIVDVPPASQHAITAQTYTEQAQSNTLGVPHDHYLRPPLVAANVLATPTASIIRAFPIYVSEPCIITLASLFQSAVATTAWNMRLGLYDTNGGRGGPGILIQDFGSVPIGITGAAARSVSCWRKVHPGWYWVATMPYGTVSGGTVPCIGQDGLATFIPSSTVPILNDVRPVGVYSAVQPFTPTVLPTAFGTFTTAGGGNTAGTAVPVVALKIRKAHRG